MGLPTIGLNSYVEIATSTAIQSDDHEQIMQSVSEWWKSDEAQKAMLEWNGFEINAPGLLKLRWRQRVEEWQRMLPDNGQPIEDCISVKELKFCTLFLQHPIAAMSLWNVMQTFYALDRLVCYTTDESWEKVASWKKMQPFEYLEASKVEKRWRSSLQNLKTEIENENSEFSMPPKKGSTMSSIMKSYDTDGGLSYSLKGVQRYNPRGPLLQRINNIDAAISRLEEAQIELERSFHENLKGVKIVDQMLEKVNMAIIIRFSMINTYLKMEGNHEDGNEVDERGIRNEVKSNHCPRQGKSSPSPSEQSRPIKPLSRTNSMEIVKNQLVIAWVSTTRGDATFSGIIVLFILLVALRYLQRFLMGIS